MTTSWYAPYLDSTDVDKRDVRRQWGEYNPFDTPNLDGSLNEDGTHSIVLDLDGKHTYRPSTTPGHGHLIIDAELSWEEYRDLLAALAAAGVITVGYLDHALRRKQTFVRKAGIVKPEGAAESDERCGGIL